MDILNTKSQMLKGVLEYCILTLLSEKEAYAAEILEQLTACKLPVVEGSVYPLLNRLKNDMLLTYRWEESKSGPPRKYFIITVHGREFLKELQTAWNDLSAAVDSIRSYSSGKTAGTRKNLEEHIDIS